MKHNDKQIPNIYYTPEEAFFHNYDTKEPPKLLNILEHIRINEKLPITFKISPIKGVSTLTVKHGGVTLIIPNVILEVTHTTTHQYGIEPKLYKPILIDYEYLGDSGWGMDGDVGLVVVLFGSQMVFDNKFIVEEIEPKVYKIQHALYPTKYLHNIQCNFANLMVTRYEQTAFAVTKGELT